MGQSSDRPNPAYEVQRPPSHCLTITPKIIRQLGKDKSVEWNQGAETALAYIGIGLQKDGILSKLLMQNKLAEQAEQIADLEKKLEDEKALNATYRAKLLT